MTKVSIVTYGNGKGESPRFPKGTRVICQPKVRRKRFELWNKQKGTVIGSIGRNWKIVVLDIDYTFAYLSRKELQLL